MMDVNVFIHFTLCTNVKLTASVLNASDDLGASPYFLGALAAASTILSKASKSTAPI
jgi:hypothetical protein